MKAIVKGVLTDHSGKVLLRRADPATPELIASPLELGVMPAETLARAFRETTGLIVHPVRLTGLYWRTAKNGSEFSFVYRCIMRGGEVTKEDGHPSAAFFDPRSLPDGLSGETHRQMDDAFRHDGGPPVLARLDADSGIGLRRFFKTRLVEGREPGEWSATTRLVIQSGQDKIAWVRRSSTDLWGLPAADVPPGQSPWETAEKLSQQYRPPGEPAEPCRLVAIQLASGHPVITFVFTTKMDSKSVMLKETETMTYLNLNQASQGLPAEEISLIETARTATDPLSLWVQS